MDRALIDIIYDLAPNQHLATRVINALWSQDIQTIQDLHAKSFTPQQCENLGTKTRHVISAVCRHIEAPDPFLIVGAESDRKRLRILQRTFLALTADGKEQFREWLKSQTT